MNTNRRTRSISRKINIHHVLELLAAFFVLDIFIIGMAVMMWCYSVQTMNGDAFNLSDVRGFSSVTSQHDRNKSSGDAAAQQQSDASYQEALLAYENAKDSNDDLLLPDGAYKNILNESIYSYASDDGTTKYVYSGSFLLCLLSCLFILAVIQFFILLSSILAGARNIRRQLRPLDELAFKAEMLGNAAALDQQALEELEQAINRISPAREETRLNTGNTEMAELERSINGLLDRMRETYRQQSRFVSDASHELRTPISVLQGYVDMLARWGKDDEAILSESIEAIKGETEHMKKLVEQLLFLARGDSGRTKLTMEPFSLKAMIQEVFDESVMIDPSHKYELLLHHDDMTITGDKSMLKQTARILMDNAAKYAPEGSTILLKTLWKPAGKTAPGEAETRDGLSEIPAFVIQDEGIGIARSDVSHMFDRFYRSDPARSKDSGGSGLGLSIAKWIVDRHGGYFEVLSREDIGTRITVCLPQK